MGRADLGYADPMVIAELPRPRRVSGDHLQVAGPLPGGRARRPGGAGRSPIGRKAPHVIRPKGGGRIPLANTPPRPSQARRRIFGGRCRAASQRAVAIAMSRSSQWAVAIAVSRSFFSSRMSSRWRSALPGVSMQNGTPAASGWRRSSPKASAPMCPAPMFS